MKIRKISKCYSDSATQYVVIGLAGAIVAVFFKDKTGLVYRVHYLTQSPTEVKNIQEVINDATKRKND